MTTAWDLLTSPNPRRFAATPGASSTITMNTATPDDQPEEWNQESLAAYLLSKGVGARKTAAAANLLIEAGYTTETELLAAKEGRAPGKL